MNCRNTLTATILLLLTPSLGLTQDAPRSFKEYDDVISHWMVSEATAESAADHELAVIELTRLYSELLSDARLRVSPTLNQYRVKIRARLMKILRELEIRINRNLPSKYHSNSDKLQSALERHLAAGTQQLGGARQFIAPRAGANLPDYGPRLVSLIQRTISPQFWEVNGGPGVIIYYPPLRVLVVRATSQIHGQIRDLNNRLR